jgi:hypothetical protein
LFQRTVGKPLVKIIGRQNALSGLALAPQDAARTAFQQGKPIVGALSAQKL